ncbi:hypothetical protein EB001_24485 [bacterium]|nr:hypothetical protein [bacterium]
MKDKTTLKLQLCNPGDNMLHLINYHVMINVPRWVWDINNGFSIKTETIKLMSTGVIKQHIIAEPF